MTIPEIEETEADALCHKILDFSVKYGVQKMTSLVANLLLAYLEDASISGATDIIVPKRGVIKLRYNKNQEIPPCIKNIQ
jgi:hypothetical protein